MAAVKLLDRVREQLRLKHYSYRTEATYIHWIKRYILFHQKRHPGEMGDEEIRAFLVHLAETGGEESVGWIEETLAPAPSSVVASGRVSIHLLQQALKGTRPAALAMTE